MASNANIISISLIKIIAVLVCITGVHADPWVCQCSSLWIIWWVPGKPWGSGTVRIRGNILCNFVDNIKYASIYMCIDSYRNHSGSQNRTWKFPVSTCLWRSIDLAQAGITFISEEYVNCHGYFSQQTPSITIYLQNYKGLCHRMKLCISVNWNMTERWLKSDWMAELHPILFSKTKMKHTWFSHFFFKGKGFFLFDKSISIAMIIFLTVKLIHICFY